MKEGDYIVLNESNRNEIEKFCNENEYIYRYLPLERFLEVLQTNKLAFVSPRLWNDPFDNFLFRQDIVNKNNFLEKLFVLCFTHNSHSQAYWKTYALEGYCVRIKLKTKEFLELLINEKDTVWLCKMMYLNESKIVENLQQKIGLKKALEEDRINKTFLNTFILKRRPFKYEEESRIIVQSRPNINGVRKLKIDIKECIKDIYLDPRMGDCKSSA